jgi:hypothetical protein|tara:strand:+ start:2356 stop:2556 length:201 start_codon:yes stop_codon:yes gene_type:complete
MSQSYEFYCARADQAAAAANKAELANVRDRELRAEKTWRGLAEHARAVAEERAKLVRDKQAEADAV